MKVFKGATRTSKPMPIISPERSKDRRDSILNAASSAFARHGFAATSISEIAALAGVSDGLVYKYFSNKRDLLDCALKAFYERVIADLEREVHVGTTFVARLRNLVRTHLGVFANDPGLCRLFISEVRVASDYPGSPIQLLNKRYSAILVRLVREGIASREVREGIDPRLVRDILFGAIEHVAWRRITTQSNLDFDRIANQIADVVVSGIASEAPSRRRVQPS